MAAGNNDIYIYRMWKFTIHNPLKTNQDPFWAFPSLSSLSTSNTSFKQSAKEVSNKITIMGH